MKTEKVYSPTLDKDFQKNIRDSEVWKECYREEEIVDIDKVLYCYYVKFDGLKPVQVTNITKVKR